MKMIFNKKINYIVQMNDKNMLIQFLNEWCYINERSIFESLYLYHDNVVKLQYYTFIYTCTSYLQFFERINLRSFFENTCQYDAYTLQPHKCNGKYFSKISFNSLFKEVL